MQIFCTGKYEIKYAQPTIERGCYISQLHISDRTLGETVFDGECRYSMDASTIMNKHQIPQFLWGTIGMFYHTVYENK